MASFGFDEGDSLTLRNAVFRLILARAVPGLSDPCDVEELEMAEAFGGLSFRSYQEPRRTRLVRAVRQGVRQLQLEVQARTDGSPLEEDVLPGIDEKLAELLSFLDAHLAH